MSNIVWFKNFPEGRFANASFQLIYAKYLEKLGYKVVLGNLTSSMDYSFLWKSFNIPVNTISYTSNHELFLGEERNVGPLESIRVINSHFVKYPNSVLCVSGYFQFDTSKIVSDPCYYTAFQETLALTSNVGNYFQNLLRKYYNKIKQNYLVTIHVRRGDYEDLVNSDDWCGQVFYLLDLDNVVKNLLNYVKQNRIQNYLVYIASDDLKFAKNYFGNTSLKILTAEDFNDNENQDENSLIIDLAAMAAANMLIASNSTLSILGSMINDQGKVFWRQNRNGDLISFDPWATPILYGPILNNCILDDGNSH